MAQDYNYNAMVRAQLRAWFMRFTVRRTRRILIAGIITALVSVSLFGLIWVTRWGGERALHSDTAAVVEQVASQLVRALNSRRGTLTFIRDTINRQSDLTQPQLKAMGASATEHTRNLLGTGLIRDGLQPEWWFGPQRVPRRARQALNSDIRKRTKLSGVWRFPSTFVVTRELTRNFLVMLEPLKASAYRRSAIIGVFDLEPLLDDFFASRLAPRYPAQIIAGKSILYRSSDWQIATDAQHPIVVEQRIAINAVRWTIQIQPGTTQVVQALSWLNVILMVIAAIASLGVVIIVWMLAARSWILQRMVKRRTAALRAARGNPKGGVSCDGSPLWALLPGRPQILVGPNSMGVRGSGTGVNATRAPLRPRCGMP